MFQLTVVPIPVYTGRYTDWVEGPPPRPPPSSDPVSMVSINCRLGPCSLLHLHQRCTPFRGWEHSLISTVSIKCRRFLNGIPMIIEAYLYVLSWPHCYFPMYISHFLLCRITWTAFKMFIKISLGEYPWLFPHFPCSKLHWKQWDLLMNRHA